MVVRVSSKAPAKKVVAKKAAPAKKVVAKKAAPAKKAASTNRPIGKDFIGRVGNLGGDPELRFTGNGMSVCTVSLAYTPYNPETKSQGETIWYRLIGFETMANQMAELLTSGMRVTVVGRPQINEWLDENGETRQTKEILVDGIGPDIRFAHVNVVRNERRGPREGTQPGMYDDEEPF